MKVFLFMRQRVKKAYRETEGWGRVQKFKNNIVLYYQSQIPLLYWVFPTDQCYIKGLVLNSSMMRKGRNSLSSVFVFGDYHQD